MYMVSPKIFSFSLLILITVFAWSFTPRTILASRSQYYDFGPYYQKSQVLGLSFSALENLPAPKIPDSIRFPEAEGLLPDSPFYLFEQLAENVQLAVTPDTIKKEDLRLQFAGERLAEARALANAGKSEAASRALADYNRTLSETVGAISRLARENNPNAKVLADRIEENIAAQAVVGQALGLSSHPVLTKDWSLTTEAGRKVLDKIADIRGERPVSEELSQSLQELKEDGLLTESESNKLYGLESRSQVRDELNKLASAGQFPVSELHKLDAAVAKYFPESAAAAEANLQVAELRVYQTLPQPSKEIKEELNRWQRNSDVSLPNSIKPYIWYNRSQALAKEVNLSNFTSEQQAEVARSYPAVANNPTYLPAPGPALSNAGDQTASPSAAEAETASEIPAEKFLGEVGGALPGDPAYILKSLGEEIGAAFTFDPAKKAEARMKQAERRLAEAGQLSKDPKKAGQYESAIKNYQKAMADAASLLRDAGDSEAAEAAAEKLEAQAARHEIVLERGLLPSPPGNPKLISEVIRSTEDVMDVGADTLDRPALPPALSSRLEDLKAQGLILSEEVEDLTRSSSRREVREKVRKLVELGSFPPADAKKLDEAQSIIAPSDYNQLVEVRKVEELQTLRAVQSELAQTPTLKATAATLNQREAALVGSLDPLLIKEEDLVGREGLLKTYQSLAATASARPINGGQFGPDVRPGEAPQAGRPARSDAVLTTCPEGAISKQSKGCVWADTGKNINDYDQYKCDGPRQYYSFAARKCVAYGLEQEWGSEDSRPICPAGYAWSWQSQGCQTFSGGGSPFPTPSPEPEPKDDAEVAERSKSCPEGSSYKAPRGCVWDKNDQPVYNTDQYRCSGRGQYYSFKEQKCVPAPKEGETYPGDAAPACKEPGTYWSWGEGKCILPMEPPSQGLEEIAVPKPVFASPGSPFYFLKQAGERVQQWTAFTTQAREQVSLNQAKERLAEAADALKKNDQEGAKTAISAYTTAIQGLVADLSNENLSEKTKEEIGQRLSGEAVEQNLLLQKLSAWAPAEQDSAINAAVSATILSVDKAADIAGESPIPDAVKERIEALPAEMISEEDKKKLLDSGSRVEVRLKIGGLVTAGGLNASETAFLNEDFDKADPLAKAQIEELKKLEEISELVQKKDEINQKTEENEKIVENLAEFERTFEPGKEISADVRPYVRLTRIDEVAQTIRPDEVRLEDFQNRKDVLLAVATLQEELKPTKEAWRRVEEFRRRNPDLALPVELARIEALSYKLGVRNQAGQCYLPTPPFPANTPCPPPGAVIPINGYYYDSSPSNGTSYNAPSVSTDKDGNPLVYGKGPEPKAPGICPSGYHWMYDSGGWCMSDGGSYGYGSGGGSYSGGPGYTPYSPYYTAPGASPATSGYPIDNSYPSSNYSYSAPSYYGPAPTYYTTNPPAGTVPGSGPAPTAPGKCPSGFHWMPESFSQPGWCMADAGTYVPSGTTTGSTPPSGGYNCGSQPYDPVTKRCKDGACPGGFDWDGSKCSARGYSGPVYSGSSYSGSSYNYSPSSYESGCTPGYYWDGSKCQKGSYEGPGWSDSAAQSGTWCQAPSGGCGSGKYWDYGSCSCRTSSVYSGSGSSGSSSGGSCPSGSHWMNENGGYCMQDSAPSGSSGGSTSGGGGSSSGSCPSGYHWMSDNGGWCMSDAARDGGSTSGSGSGSTSTPTTTSTTTTTTSTPPPSSEPAPSTSTTTTTTTESSPPPSEPAPAPSTSTTTGAAPPPSP